MNETALNGRFDNLTDLTKGKTRRMLLLQNTILISELLDLDKWEYLRDDT